MATVGETANRVGDELSWQRGHILSLASEIRYIIVKDIPYYFETQAKQAFLSDLDFAERLDDGRLKFFRAKLREAAKKCAEATQESLSSEQIWLEGEGSGKTLEEHAKIWPILLRIRDDLSAFLSSEFLDAEVEDYKTPARFIEGKYLPGTIEKYWLSLVRYRELLSEKESEILDKRRSVQAQRWEETG